MDIALRLGGNAQSAQLIAVVGYQQKRGATPQFAALLLTSPPLKAQVNDEQACPLPEHTNAWDAISISCFDLNGKAIPVLDLYRLFNPPRIKNSG